MKRIAFSLMVLFFLTGTAFAEHKLFITDVLDAGQFEQLSTISYSYATYDFTNNAIPLTGTATNHNVTGHFSIDGGLGKGIQLGVGLPVIFHDRTKFDYHTSPPSSNKHTNDGLGDISLFGKFRLVNDDAFKLVAAVNVKFNTSNDAVTSDTTDIAPYLAASTRVGEDLRPYAVYQAVIRNHGVGDSHVLIVGAENKFSPRVSLDGDVFAAIHTGSDFVETNESFGGGLSLYLELADNFYLIPSTSVVAWTPTDRKDYPVHFDTEVAVSGALGFYFLF